MAKPIPKGFTAITEGRATILFPTNNGVFYNPVQEFNRDLSIATIRCWSKLRRAELASKNATRTDTNNNAKISRKFKLAEALAASGLRSIRYAKELDEELSQIIANDMSADAVESIKRNCEFNDIPEGKVVANRADACDLMYAHRHPSKRFDIVDIDPYGSAAPFLDAALQSVEDGGLLLVTCTDMAVLASGKNHETCFYKYGGVPLKSEFSHEMALRILLHSIQSAAGRYKRYIQPLVSLSIDFYARVFVRVFTSPSRVKMTESQTAMVYQCFGCKTFHTQPLGGVQTNGNSVKHTYARLGCNVQCEECGNQMHVGGPMWNAPLHDKQFVEAMLSHLRSDDVASMYGTHQRMLGMLTVASEVILYWLYNVTYHVL